MRTSIVPAQITTIEDKVTGNLSMSQLLLLSTPIFTSGVIYLLAPPMLGSAIYKTILMLSVGVVSWILAIRVKGRILLSWAITIGRYNSRARYHVLDKNDSYLRHTLTDGDAVTDSGQTEPDAKPITDFAPQLTFAETVFLERIAADPNAGLQFKANRKGDLRVRIREVK
jgi:hypothetical protein